MNWGNRLLLVFIVFGSGIGYMVYRCMKTPVDLVSAQYYKDELAYQRVIDGTRQANALSGSVKLVSEAGGVRVQLPAEMKNRHVQGTVQFYCPNDAGRDRLIALNTEAGEQEIAGSGLAPGRYTVKISWTASGTSYFTEQAFNFQP
jgi:hypothetical protein